MPNLFDLDVEASDIGYINLRDARSSIERDMQSDLEAMWSTYEPYADPDFRSGFARDLDARFWEMYLGCVLIEAGKQLLPVAQRQRHGGQPDICVIENDRRVWIEAIAPDRGVEGPDRVREPRPINDGGGFVPVPERQAQLRISSALWTKSQVLRRYLDEGTIRPEDVRVIAIGGGRFGRNIPESGLPLIISTVFPLGAERVTINRHTREIVDQGFETSLTIPRGSGRSIPRTALLEGPFEHVSGLLWSRASIGNAMRAARPLTFVHNPRADVIMPQRWGPWDREFVATEHGDHFQLNELTSREHV
jgi:hypothetical protein